jgi:uncharacterized protein involved in exopolysaccharide biosynthesis
MTHDAPACEETSAASPGFTLRDFLSIVFQHWRTIATTSLVVSIVLGAGMLRLPPTYIAEGKLLVQTDRQAAPSFFGGIAAYGQQRDPDPVNRRLETEMELLSTRGLSEGVVRSLGLRYDDVFHPAYVHLLNPLADLYEHVRVEWLGRAPAPGRRAFDSTVRDFNRSFVVAPLKSKSAETTSNIIAVKLSAPDPALARESLQRLLDGYVDFAVRMNQASGVEAYKVVQQNLERARLDMASAQERLRLFYAHAAMPPPREDSSLHRIGFARGGARDGAGEMAGPEVARDLPDDELAVRAMRTRLVDMELRLAEARRSYQDDSESVRNLAHGIGELRQRVRAASLQTAAYRTEQMQLERELRTSEDMHGELNRKLAQISLFLAANPRQADVRAIVEPPLAPSSSEWRKALILWALGSIGGVVLGFGLVGLRAYNDHTLQTAEDVRRHLGVALLATVPLLPPRERGALEPPRPEPARGGAAR